jgi:hypothetical protein
LPKSKWSFVGMSLCGLRVTVRGVHPIGDVCSKVRIVGPG